MIKYEYNKTHLQETCGNMIECAREHERERKERERKQSMKQRERERKEREN